MVVLLDVSGDIPSAIKALRMRVTDYVLTRAADAEIGQRFAALAERIEAFGHLGDEVMAEMSAPSGAYAAAGNGLYHGATALGNGNGSHHHNIWWDANLCAIRSDEMWVPLSPIEWKLFETLVNKRGIVVATEDLINTALARSGTSAADTSLLRLHVSRLRAKLNEHFAQDLSIVTMRGRGYMLI
jgi:DNA-binding response OmpR family regulator